MKMLIFNKAPRPSSPSLTQSLLPIKRTELIILLIFQLLNQWSFAESDDGVRAGRGCSLYKEVGPNDLSINDIVVKSATSNVVCIKARFSLAIKVEAVPSITIPTRDQPIIPADQDSKSQRLVLGYLPLDSVIDVRDNCPGFRPPPPSAPSSPKKNNQAYLDNNIYGNGNGNSNDKLKEQDRQAKIDDEPEELVMIVGFECGKLNFYFKREENYFLSAIKGIVNLDSNTIREFFVEQPMFFTSDLNHHFKFNELVEVNSTAKVKGFFLSANFYNSEFETFRNTSSRSFIRPADDYSKPFLDS